MKEYCFGIDIGGTTVKCGLFNVKGDILEKWEIPTRTENNGVNILPDVAATIDGKDPGKRHRPRRRSPVWASASRDRSMRRVQSSVP